MGSVQSEKECPQCGGTMVVDYLYKTDEEYRFCDCCGKYESWVAVRDENNHVVRNKNGKVRYKHTDRKGYGCVCIATKKHGATVTSLEKPPRKKDIDRFLSLIESEDVYKENCYFTKWDNKEKKVVSVYGELPK